MRPSRAESILRSALRVGLGLALISPYLVWLAEIREWTWPSLEPWTTIAARGVGQAGLSSFFSFVVGGLMFRGLRSLGPVQRARGELRVLAPSAIPPLFVALATLGLGTPSAPFPFGLGAVVFAHVLVSAGVIAVALERFERARLGALAEVAWVSGVSEFTFWRRIAWPLWRRDVATLAFYVFTSALTSFSIPLLLQGGPAVSLDVAIYDLIRLEGRWDVAVVLAALQSVALLGLALVLPRAAALPRSPEPRELPFRPHPAWGVLTWLPLALGLTGLARGLSRANLDVDLDLLARATLTTAAIGAATAATTLFGFVVVAYVYPHARLERFLRGYLAPSPAIVGFATLLALPDSWPIARVVGALTLISFAPLYRWQVHAALAALRAQWTVADSLGANPFRTFVDVTWPQAGPALLEASGLAAVWAAGDFAISGLLLDRAETLPRLMADAWSHYQWGTAYGLLVPLTLTAGLLHSIYRAMANHVRN